MSTPLPHTSAALQRTIALSLGVHAIVIVSIAAGATHAAPPPRALLQHFEAIELDGSDLAASESGIAGREDAEQGAPPPRALAATPAPVAAAPAQATPPPRDEARPPQAPPKPAPPPPKPASAPPPHEPPDVDPRAAPTSARPDPDAVDPPSPPASPRRDPPRRTAHTTPTSSPVSSANAANAGEPTSSASAPTSEPGGGGGPVRTAARDLAASFARELPPSSDAMPAWRTLPVGTVGEVTVEITTDDDGRLTGDSRFAEETPNEALVEVVRRTRARLGRSVMAPSGPVAGPGVVKLHLTARIAAITVDGELPGGPFDLSFAFHGERGECAFSLPEGRRITVSIDVVSRRPPPK